MNTLLVAILSFAGFIVAYHTYGRFLARRIFRLDPAAITPAREVNDGVDFVPTHRQVIFGHHFTSIAGTGPIVGPALAVIWGWVPALLWVVFGSIFIGAVHDLGALVVSLRSRGQTIGDAAGRMISRRARLLFLFILFFGLMVVIAIFGLVIAGIFKAFPESVLPVWAAMPLAMLVGFWIRRGGKLLAPSLFALAFLYLAVFLGTRFEIFQITLGTDPAPGASLRAGLGSPVALWTFALLVYCFCASVLPVWMLLQPRDYINSHQLFVGLVLLIAGLAVAQPGFVAPPVHLDVPNAPPIFPFLFITIACGAVSGFHCLVSSGTTSKQLSNEIDAQYVGYGGMLLEGALSVLVIIACGAGLGLGLKDSGLTGVPAWQSYYGGSWNKMEGLGATVGAFVNGGGNMIAALGIPSDYAVAIVGVMVACFATTTLDTSVRLQRYVIQELAAALRLRALNNKYTATAFAVVSGGLLALIPGPDGRPGTGGMILWPMFGAINQVLAGLSFLVVAFYLIRHKRPVWFLVVPLVLMVLLPAWAMYHQLINFYGAGKWLLFGVGTAVQGLQLWMILEGAILWRKARGVLPEPLSPLRPTCPAGTQTRGPC